MALDRNIATQLSNLVSLGDTITYVETANAKDTKTFTDINNILAKSLNRYTMEILTAIYDMTPQNKKINGFPYAISKSGSKYMVTSIKNAKTEELKIDIKPNKFTVFDKLTNKRTTIELKGVIEKKKSDIEPLKSQMEKGLKHTRTDEDVINLAKDILNLK